MYNTTAKTFIKSSRALATILSDITITEYTLQVGVVRAIYQLRDKDGVCNISDLKEALNIIETSLSATDTDLNDFDGWEFKELLEKVLDEKDTDDFYLELPCGEVRIIDKEEIDQIWHDSLIEQIKECYDLSNLPGFVEIDWDATADNCKGDGLGHHFSTYDGGEHSTETHYIFRTN